MTTPVVAGAAAPSCPNVPSPLYMRDKIMQWSHSTHSSYDGNN
jgi:hypothetical protein